MTPGKSLNFSMFYTNKTINCIGRSCHHRYLGVPYHHYLYTKKVNMMFPTMGHFSLGCTLYALYQILEFEHQNSNIPPIKSLLLIAWLLPKLSFEEGVQTTFWIFSATSDVSSPLLPQLWFSVSIECKLPTGQGYLSTFTGIPRAGGMSGETLIKSLLAEWLGINQGNLGNMWSITVLSHYISKLVVNEKNLIPTK